MRRRFVVGACAALLLAAPSARAQTPPPVEEAPLAEAETKSDLLAPTPPEWKLAYDDARAKLLTGDFASAAVKFRELERSAVNRVDRALAREQASLAAEWASRGLAFVSQKDLGESGLSARAVDRRTTDELVSLYTNGVFYGIGTGIWLAVETEMDGRAAILASIATTGVTTGSIIALDSGRGLRYGVAQSIVSGLYIGLEEGIAWGAWSASKKDSETTGKEVGTMIWGLSTAGAVAGGIIGQTVGTTPGRASWVGSTALWTGLVPSFVAGAVADDNHAAPAAFATAGVGLSAGTAIGLLTASTVSPSIARVRFIDLGGLSGGLLGIGLYAAATKKGSREESLVITALGASAGLGTAFALTASMPEDRPRTPTETEPATARVQWRPTFLPADRGLMMGVSGIVN